MVAILILLIGCRKFSGGSFILSLAAFSRRISAAKFLLKMSLLLRPIKLLKPSLPVLLFHHHAHF
ncbi:MAG: hypothetical protein M3033_03815, partial [Acidobacteriota bacterium]|nr:hypothetical protein [Acidobacteriota bacterium]